MQSAPKESTHPNGESPQTRVVTVVRGGSVELVLELELVVLSSLEVVDVTNSVVVLLVVRGVGAIVVVRTVGDAVGDAVVVVVVEIDPTPPPHAQHASRALVRTPLCVVAYAVMLPHHDAHPTPGVPSTLHHWDPWYCAHEAPKLSNHPWTLAHGVGAAEGETVGDEVG